MSRQFDLYAVERDCVERVARLALWLTVKGALSYYWVATRLGGTK